MIKVKITNKRLWGNFIKVVSVIASVLSLILAFIDIEQSYQKILLLCLILLLFAIFVVMLIYANKKKRKKFKINGTNINIFYGDIFKQSGVKIIAFNEFFDTKVDNKIISTKSLNGIYITQHSAGSEVIDVAIDSEILLKKSIVKENVIRQYGGKTTQYKLGAICPFGDYYLLAFSHFDDDNRAYISFEDYISCLMNMWNEIDKYYNGELLSITLLGSGITRVNSNKIASQELLKHILFTFKSSMVTFHSSLNIVLDERIKDEINLYDIWED